MSQERQGDKHGCAIIIIIIIMTSTHLLVDDPCWKGLEVVKFIGRNKAQKDKKHHLVGVW